MRQKVGKERSQGVFAPLAIPRCYPNLAELTPVCVCPDGRENATNETHKTGRETHKSTKNTKKNVLTNKDCK